MYIALHIALGIAMHDARIGALFEHDATRVELASLNGVGPGTWQPQREEAYLSRAGSIVMLDTLRGPVPTWHYSGPGGLAAGLSSPLARSHNERPLSAANSATLLAMRAAHSMVPAATLRPDE